MKKAWNVARVVMFAGLLLLGVGVLAASADKDDDDDDDVVAKVKTVKVDCDKGKSIGKALKRRSRKPLVVMIEGTCNENVIITRDDVTVRGRPGMGDTVAGPDPNQPTIQVDGAVRTVIENLTVTKVAFDPAAVVGSGGSGIGVGPSGQARIDRTVVENNSGTGISIFGASTATITDSTIRGSGFYGLLVLDASRARLGFLDAPPPGNVFRENTLDGILVTRASSVFMFRNEVRDNGRNGVLLTLGGVARMFGANTIRDNGSSGVALFRLSSLQTGETDTPLSDTTTVISDNTGSGIFAGENSSVVLRGGVSIERNRRGIALQHGSRLQTRQSTVSNNTNEGIQAVFASSVRLDNPVNTITGNRGVGLVCFDDESSAVGNFSGISGNDTGSIPPAPRVQVSCTDFSGGLIFITE